MNEELTPDERAAMRARLAWREVAKGIGQPVTVNLPDRSLQGIFSGIDAQGMLLLDLPDGTRQAIAAGDVFFLGHEGQERS